MSLLPKLQRYSRKQYAAALLLFFLLLFIAGQGETIPVLALLALPSLLFFKWVFRQQQYGVTDREVEQLGYVFLGGFFLVSPLAMAAQLVLVPALAFLCFFDQRENIEQQLRSFLDESTAAGSSFQASPGSRFAHKLLRMELHKSVGYYVFLLALAFVVAALVEEFLKLWLVQGTCCCGSSSSTSTRSKRGCCGGKTASLPAFTALKQRQQRQRHGAIRGWLCHPSRLLFFHRTHANHSNVVVLAVIAGALGFSLLENTAYTFAAGSLREKLVTAALRGAASTSLHCICGGITGVRLAEKLLAHRQEAGESRGPSAARVDLARWRSKLRVMAPAVLIHGVFDAQLFILTALVTEDMLQVHPTSYGVVLPSVLTLSILVASLVYLWRVRRVLLSKTSEARYVHVAVDLESGHRSGALNGDVEDAMDFFSDDAYEDEDEVGETGEDTLRGGVGSKVRSVFSQVSK